MAETAKELGILVITDEVYGHLTFGSKPFVPVGVFGSIVPVITLGSISKRWAVTGWKLGWLVTCDPSGNLQKSKVLPFSFSPCIYNFSRLVCIFMQVHQLYLNAPSDCGLPKGLS